MIIPALLTLSKKEFIEKLSLIENSASIAQIDIMNNTFVPGNTFFDPHELATIKTNIQYELHFMVNTPSEIMEQFATTPNIVRAYTHIEAIEPTQSNIENMRYHGWQTGIAINPTTDPSLLRQYAQYIDAVLCMGVTPGASGRSFHNEIFNTIAYIKQNFPHLEIAVDGGVNETTLPQLIVAGATRFVAGSAIFNSQQSPAEAITTLNSFLV